jgi:Stress responsive A/B Barrel Domain
MSRLLHSIGFTWRSGVTDEDVDRFDAALRQYASRARGLHLFICGENVGTIEGNADYGIVALFESKEAFERYRQHPDHIALVKETLSELVQSRTGIQIDADQPVGMKGALP